MGKTKPINEHVKQKSIGLRLDQWEFFTNHPEFNIAEFVRYAIDQRIEVINSPQTTQTIKQEREDTLSKVTIACAEDELKTEDNNNETTN